MTKEKYLLFPIELDKKGEVNKPNIDSLAIFPSLEEANKAKDYLKGSGMLVIVVPIAMVGSYKEFKELWEQRAKDAILTKITGKA